MSGDRRSDRRSLYKDPNKDDVRIAVKVQIFGLLFLKHIFYRAKSIYYEAPHVLGQFFRKTIPEEIKLSFFKYFFNVTIVFF